MTGLRKSSRWILAIVIALAILYIGIVTSPAAPSATSPSIGSPRPELAPVSVPPRFSGQRGDELAQAYRELNDNLTPFEQKNLFALVELMAQIASRRTSSAANETVVSDDGTAHALDDGKRTNFDFHTRSL